MLRSVSVASEPFLELARGLDDNRFALDLVLHGLRKMTRVGSDLRVLHVVFEGDESPSAVARSGGLSKSVEQVLPGPTARVVQTLDGFLREECGQGTAGMAVQLFHHGAGDTQLVFPW